MMPPVKPLHKGIGSMMSKLEYYRRKRGKTIEEVAAAAGCSLSMVSMVERGIRRPSPALAGRLCDAIGIGRREWKSLQDRA